MIKAKRDCMNAIFILVFCGFAYYETLSIAPPVLGKTGAALFPNIVIGVVVFLDLCFLITSILRIKKEKNTKLDLSVKKWLKENKKVLLTFVIFGIYVLLLGYIGYIISTMLFLFAVYLLLAQKSQKLWKVGLGIISLTLIIFFIFQDVLSVFLPTGIWS